MMRWETFVKKYKPIKNTIIDTSCFDGYMFETYGEEIKALQDMANEFAKRDGTDKNGYHVWTVLDGEGNSIIISNGWHFVNRLGYMITEVPWKEGDEIDVK